ncbi:NAD(P)H-quinone oxidoreductase [Spirosoma endophyticum]|uniref:Putative NAD(P)H quinone oxidoreductase, PIG3 family n=1 Tax=Spirosoma endophyticum TaxID=662367 RepID=A0A1I1GVL6_9BACT|nr:NAD(P)H-quinone oxidoreductase [Spirosoma endophyticum]SFC15591.1 putative NAD(P)H quinone oxidoreductase, PIG3 family [Spirosoma endophyticum]
MKAMIITRPGDGSVLQLQEHATPQPQAGQVLIRVHAAGVNRSDIHQRQGGYGSDPRGQIPGLEVAGVIEKCGSNVSRWQVGDAVCALLKGGGYAEYVAVDERHCLPVPSNLTFVEAASLPETVLTVWSTVFQWGHLRQGENFLVHGGSSGIGVTAIQLAKAFGANAYATAGSDEKRAVCEQLGAIKCINYKKEDFEKALSGIEINVILDMVGGEYTPKNLRLMALDSRLMFINSMQGADSQIHIPTLMQKRITISGSMLKPRDDDFKAALTADVEKQVWPLLTDGQLKPLIYRTFPLAEAAQAQALMESSEHTGKIILDLDT